MSSKTSIEWTEVTWNPVTGCTKVSQGCKHCYAERMAKRLKAMGSVRYADGFNLTLHYDLLEAPKHWTKPRLIFVNSMSDLFHDDVPDEFIRQVFKTIEACPQHTFQILTKRDARLRSLGRKLSWPANLWMGVSVENESVQGRIISLQHTPARIRFLSLEPLLGPLESLPLQGIDWVIVGGESGPGSRPMARSWVLSILRQCRKANVSFFFKQWGGVRKASTGRVLNGKTYDELPAVSAV